MPVSLSFWEKEAFFKDIDIMIIGSGIVGLNAAIAIKERQAGLRVVVVERGSLPTGASTRNAGFACFGSMTELLDDCSKGQEDAVWALVEKRWRGLQNMRQRLGDAAIEFRAWGGYELFRKEESKDYQACLDHMEHLNKQLSSIIGDKRVFEKANDQLRKFGFKHIPYLIFNKAEGQLHTGKMMAALSAKARDMGIAIFNGIQVSKVEEDQGGAIVETTEGWTLRAQQLIVATNGLTRRLLPDLAVAPARNQVLITKPVSGLKIKGTFHYDRGFFYFRNVENRLLLGGGRCLDLKGEETDEFGLTERIQMALLDLLKNTILPSQSFEIEQWWSGIMGVGTIKEPIIQRLGPHITVAVRLGGMGVAIGALVGEEAAEMALSNG